MRSMLALFILFISILMTSAFAQDIPDPVKAKLVSNIESVNPGNSFKLGVLFEIDPGWHIYWKYPGETGLPTKIKFNIPEGYQAEELIWPIPKAFKKTDGGMDFGYENSVVLWTNIKVPPDVGQNEVANIETQLSWVSCKEICIPGKKSLAYDLKITQETSFHSEDIFSKWHNYLPLQITDTENPFKLEIVTKKTGSDTVNVNLLVSHKDNNGEINYFPNPSNFMTVKNLTSVKSENDNRTEISFDVKAQGKEMLNENSLDGLLVYSNKKGTDTAVEFKIDLNDT